MKGMETGEHGRGGGGGKLSVVDFGALVLGPNGVLAEILYYACIGDLAGTFLP